MLGAVALLGALALVASACGSKTNSSPTAGSPSAGGKQFVFGMILVGPYNDHGWSQAHYEAGKYLESQLHAKMIYLDKVNSADRPSVKAEDVISQMINNGAQMIFATSDDFKDAILSAAAAHPTIPMVWSTGDSAWAQGQDYKANLTNLSNYYMKMEYTQAIAGCAAALTTQTGKIGVVGPLINDETRRFVNAAYLGANYCWTNYRKQDPSKLGFDVKWIGFWFNIPGTTLDPTQVTNDLINSGADVVIDHLDTTEALVRTGQLAAAGKKVWAIGYDFKDACAVSPAVCLGVPYFNWDPGYLKLAKSVIAGSFKSTFTWDAPVWSNVNNATTSPVGWQAGQALSSANAATLQQYEAGLADGSIKLFSGPLNWQDGSVYLPAGQAATDAQIWYTPQLLQGVQGASQS
jgi:simple sugar transport system substrate-binding protein